MNQLCLGFSTVPSIPNAVSLCKDCFAQLIETMIPGVASIELKYSYNCCGSPMTETQSKTTVELSIPFWTK